MHVSSPLCHCNLGNSKDIRPVENREPAIPKGLLGRHFEHPAADLSLEQQAS